MCERAGNKYVNVRYMFICIEIIILKNRGIWTRDIKSATNIPQHQLAKTLKTLEQRNLIKSVRSVTSKSKKLYMLYDATPTKDITGGPWYTDQEFDHEFIEELHSYIVQIVSSKGMLSIGAISESVRMSGISRVCRITLLI